MTEVELGVPALWLLTAIGVLSGAGSLWAFRRFSNPSKVRLSINHVIAHLFELRLFADEPALILRSQRDLLSANWDFLRQMTSPSLLLAMPFAILLLALKAFFGHAPLEIGKPAIVTVHCSQGILSPTAKLVAPAGIEVETPALRIPTTSEISWRIRPIESALGYLQFSYDGQIVRKSISSTDGVQWLSDSRAGSLKSALLHPLESPFLSSNIRLISVGYPDATVFHFSWLVWFSATSLAGACASALILRFR